MAKIMLEHQDEILTFPTDSILELKIDEVTIETVQSQRGGDWQKSRFKFKILGIQALGDGSRDFGPYESWITRDIWGSVPWRLTDSAENRLRIWAEAIFRQELGEGFELDSDMFLHRQVRGITSQYDAKGRDSSGAAFKRHQIETLLPWNDSASQQPQGQPQAAPQQWSQPAGPANPQQAVNQGGWGQPGQQPGQPPAQQQQQQPQPVAAAVQDPWAPQTGFGDEPPF